MNKTINIEGGHNVQIEQTIVDPKPQGPSVGGVSLTTGYGWGVDVGVILIIVGLLYVGKKVLDRLC
jgi:hypothetical protein